MGAARVPMVRDVRVVKVVRTATPAAATRRSEGMWRTILLPARVRRTSWCVSGDQLEIMGRRGELSGTRYRPGVTRGNDRSHMYRAD